MAERQKSNGTGGFELENPSHRHFVDVAASAGAAYRDSRDGLNDRALARAEHYLEARAQLMDLIRTAPDVVGFKRPLRADLYDA
jgi:hypothetical protein